MRKKGDFFLTFQGGWVGLRVGWIFMPDMFDMMATVELSQAGDSSNEQKAIHFASCQAISQSRTGHKNA